MKVVILCGGQGSRLREHTESRPKPMVEIGGRPIVWHIMKTYGHYGYRDFVLCLGYRGEVIEEYFSRGAADEEGWNVTLADTGQETAKGGRLLRAARHIDGDEFMFTYGDGVSTVDIGRLAAFHRQRGRLVTFTGVRPRSRWAVVEANENGNVTGWKEKLRLSSYINGGFFVLSRRVLDYIEDHQEFEEEPMERLTAEGQVAMFRHDGFWECMDTFRDYRFLNDLWKSGRAEWAVWREGTTQ